MKFLTIFFWSILENTKLSQNQYWEEDDHLDWPCFPEWIISIEISSGRCFSLLLFFFFETFSMAYKCLTLIWLSGGLCFIGWRIITNDSDPLGKIVSLRKSWTLTFSMVVLDASIRGHIGCRLQGNWSPRNWSKVMSFPDRSLRSISGAPGSLAPPSKTVSDARIWGNYAGRASSRFFMFKRILWAQRTKPWLPIIQPWPDGEPVSMNFLIFIFFEGPHLDDWRKFNQLKNNKPRSKPFGTITSGAYVLRDSSL